MILRIKEQETRLTLQERDDDDDDENAVAQYILVIVQQICTVHNFNIINYYKVEGEK